MNTRRTIPTGTNTNREPSFKLFIGGSFTRCESLLQWYIVNRRSRNAWLFGHAASKDFLSICIAQKALEVGAAELPQRLESSKALLLYQEVLQSISGLHCTYLSGAIPLTGANISRVGERNFSDDPELQEYYQRHNEKVESVDEFFYLDENNVVSWDDLADWIEELRIGASAELISESSTFYLSIRRVLTS